MTWKLHLFELQVRTKTRHNPRCGIKIYGEKNKIKYEDECLLVVSKKLILYCQNFWNREQKFQEISMTETVQKTSQTAKGNGMVVMYLNKH